MKKRLIPLFSLSFASMLVSCKPSSSGYSLKAHIADKELGYVILVGEDRNPEAEDRTKGCIKAMEEVAKKYKLTAKKLEQTTSKDGNGASWSDTQAKVLMESWVGRHGNKIDFVISNNDGMAIAAASVQTLEKGTPIVGFDALKTACLMVERGELAGSVSQNGTDQAYITALALGTMLTPESGATAKGGRNLIADYNGNAEVDWESINKHIIQTKLAAVTKANAKKFKPGAYVKPKNASLLKDKKILYCLYDSKDNYIGETYANDLPHYIKALGGTCQALKGENDNSKMLEAVRSADSSGKFDAYAFNIPEHTTWQEYLRIVGYEFDASGACTKKGKPVIFFNRQPKTGDDVADLSAKNLDDVYYVGTGSTGQGEAQGKVIKDWFDANMPKK